MDDGRLFIGNEAIEAGLVDGVSTLDALVKELSDSGGDSGVDSAILNRSFGDKNIMGKDNEKLELTAGFIAAERPEVYAQIKKTGFDEGVKSTETESFNKGAEAERDRIKAVEEQTLPGHEELIAALKYDGKTTGPEAAVKVLNAEKGIAQAMAQAIKEDSPDAVDSAEAALKRKKEFSNLLTEDRAKAEWESKPEIREE